MKKADNFLWVTSLTHEDQLSCVGIKDYLFGLPKVDREPDHFS